MVMSLIESLTRIKNAVYGREVREAIHDGVFRANQVADENKDLVDQVAIRQDAVEQYNNQMIAEMTDKDVISAPEIIQARGGKATLGQRLDDTTAQLAHMENSISITPDDFEGNDLEKIQQAVEYVKAKNGGVIRIQRLYDITSLGSVMLDKTDARDRRVISFVGDGGKIVKNDSGFIFDSNIENSGDWFFNNVTFESTEGAKTFVFNGVNLIRLQFTECHTRNVDGYATAENSYFQSIYVTGGSTVGGKGWLFEAPCYYDVVITGGYFCEHREHFLKQTSETTGEWRAINGLRFTNSMVEGLSGKTFEFTRIEQLTIEGNYFESNKQGYIDMSKADYIDAVSISNNRVYHHPDTNYNDLTSFIKWGERLRGVSTRNNFSRYLAMHDTTNVVPSVIYSVHSYQDVAMDGARDNIPNIDPYDIVINNDLDQFYKVFDGNLGDVVQHNENATDLNDVNASGYLHVNSTTHSNVPPEAGIWFFVETIRFSSSFILQKAMARGSGLGVVYVRSYEQGTWLDWKRITLL